MLRQRKDLSMLVALRRPSIDATIVDDQRRSLKCLQDRPSSIDVRKIKIFGLESIVSGRYNSHRPKDAILVDQQTMGRAQIRDHFLWIRVDEWTTGFRSAGCICSKNWFLPEYASDDELELAGGISLAMCSLLIVGICQFSRFAYRFEVGGSRG